MNKMVVTTLESKFRCYDLRTEHPTDGFSYMTEKAHVLAFSTTNNAHTRARARARMRWPARHVRQGTKER